MSDVTYRPYLAADAEDVKQIIDEAFVIHRYVKNPRLLNSALEIYLRERLVASTWTRVAVRDGRVIGTIMGQIAGQHRLPGRWRNRAAIGRHMASLALRGFPERRSLTQYFAFGPAYRRLRDQTRSPLTDELTLFAVAAASRGLGVGKSLYGGFLAELRAHGRTDFHLYTDSLCTYGFYERQGMARAASGELTVLLDGEPETLQVYLYTGTVGAPG